MKVLFISSGNNGNINVLVENQAKTLRDLGVEIDHFLILGKGLAGYLKNVPRIRSFLKKNRYDVIHAHYSLSAIATSLAGAKKLVVSLMGSDAYLNVWMKLAARFFYSFFWKETIVKTVEMKDSLKLTSAHVIPNGVNLDLFKPMNQTEARNLLGIDLNSKIIVFLADPQREEKNFPLAKESVSLLNRNDVKLLPVYNVPNNKIPYYLNAANVLLLTSKWEGSVNVVKEALSCNLPIVSTDVGDVSKNMEGVSGCYISLENPGEIKDKINQALEFNDRNKGREQIISLGLDSESIARKIFTVYKKVINES